MLAKKYRVPIQSFPKKAKTLLVGKFFVVKHSSNTLWHSRAGVVIRRGSVEGSVNRNKLRRAAISVLEKNKGLLEKPGTDYLVVIGGPDKLDGKVFGELTEELESAIKKLKE